MPLNSIWMPVIESLKKRLFDDIGNSRPNVFAARLASTRPHAAKAVGSSPKLRADNPKTEIATPFFTPEYTQLKMAISISFRSVLTIPAGVSAFSLPLASFDISPRF